MMGSAIIEVGIGLVLVYILLSIIVTQVNNVIVNVLNLRAEHLRDGMERLITDPALQYEVMSHPMINVVASQMALRQRPNLRQMLTTFFRDLLATIFAPSLVKRHDTAGTSFVDPDVFANVLVDVCLKSPELAGQLQNVDVPKFIELMKQYVTDVNLERTLETVLTTATTIQEAQEKLKGWFNNGMNQLSDLFKRRLQYVSFMVGLLLAAILNVDSINMALSFWNDPALRQIAVEAGNAAIDNQAQLQAGQVDPGNLTDAATAARASIDGLMQMRLPIGWTFESTAAQTVVLNGTTMTINPYENARNFANVFNFSDPLNWLIFMAMKLTGWVITAFAVIQGAEFWFNLLRQLTGRTSSK